jgi:GT2 family glycosyltransferase
MARLIDSDTAAGAGVVVVIVNYQTPDLTKACLRALRGERSALPKLTAIVVDGGSGDGSADKLAATIAGDAYRNWVDFLPLAINGGFGWANNQAILALSRQPQPPTFIHLLNPDTEIQTGSIAELINELRRHPCCAAVGSQLINGEAEPTASAFRFPSIGREFISGSQSEKLGRLLGIKPTVVQSADAAAVDWVTGASVMLRVEALQQAGPFDDGFFLYFEEVEFMHRLRALGWTVRHVPTSRVVHLEGSSTGLSAASRRLPRYWYDSRRRYFALTGGRTANLLANAAWLGGRAMAWAKALASRSEVNKAMCVSDFLRTELQRRATVAPSVPRWGDAPGKLPAWMDQR